MIVSVIVPVYNIEDSLSFCVNSIISQDYSLLDIILVDDGSSDKSPYLCDEWAAKDKRIRVIHKKNGGLSSARNSGLDIASGKYILFVDGDDYLANGAISTFVEIIQKCDVDFIQFGYEEVNGYDDCNRQCSLNKESLKESLSTMYFVNNRHDLFGHLYSLGGVAASVCTKFMKLETVNSLRFKEGFLHEDEEFTTRLLSRSANVCYINDFLPYKYVMRKGSIIHSDFNIQKLYNLTDIYEDRLRLFNNLKYDDLTEITAIKLFSILVLLYGQAFKVKDDTACLFIHEKIRFLLQHYKMKLTRINYIIACLYKIGTRGNEVYYRIRKMLGK